MNNVTKKWVLLKVSSAILVPLMCWFIINFVGIFVLLFIAIYSASFYGQ